MENWKIIEDFTNYAVSDLGRVKNRTTGRIMKPGLRAGYPSVSLYKSGKAKNFTIHRLVASAFIPNPNNLPCINHKDEDKTNCVVDNLEWCTFSYNNNYREKGKRISDSKKNLCSRCCNMPARKVACYTKDGELVEVFDSMYDAKRKYNYSPGSIHSAINNKIRIDRRGREYKCLTAYGYQWKYVS